MVIIIVAETWGSNAGIGSLRPMKMAKYLLQKGHEVHIVCGNKIISENDSELKNLRKNSFYKEHPIFITSGVFDFEEKIKNYCLSKRKENKKRKNSLNSVDEFKGNNFKNKIKSQLIYLYSNLYGPLKQLNKANTAFSKLKDFDKLDVIISSYEPLNNTILGKQLKKKYPSSIWVSDFRDQIPRPYDPNFFKLIRRKIQKYLCRTSDIITIVSETWKANFEKDGIKNVYMLSSGYDVDDFIDAPMNDMNYMNYLSFTYTGNLYEEKYDITPVVRSLLRLIQSKKIEPNKILINYAGKMSAEFSRQTKALRKFVKIVNHGFVSRNEALALQLKSDILLHAAWSTKKDKGIMTGKIYEYLLAKKPIISIIQGDEVGSELGIMLRKAKVGFVYVEAENQPNSNLDRYIESQYIKKFCDGYIEYNADSDFISQFDYKNIVDELLSMIAIQNSNKVYYSSNVSTE